MRTPHAMKKPIGCITLLLDVFLVIRNINTCLAFTTHSSNLPFITVLEPCGSGTINRRIYQRGCSLVSGTQLRVTGVAGSTSSEPSKLLDKNDNEFTVGCTVRLATECRAFHAPGKALGYFSPDDKSFVPVDKKEVPRSERCLILPPGLEGSVQRLYDIDDFDANLPVVVRFTEGEGGDYELPSSFSMHFDTHELEVVD